ncbi:hypothetical protein GGX14DRAFT_532195 [Mycena pura]|uniref:Uncharacterized protein n=1 Tax=Mycena pura TaxID=153505 RepID=A0AAD6YKQ5_9AGAR|nr:hypothetical protein GGX14DRAFT_532195 [Mycena pura]
MVSAVESWRTRTRTPVDGELKCMQDGRVWKEIKDTRGDSFFYGASSEEEIRLGVSFSLDWFDPSKSSFSPSHSSGAMSFCVQNLPNSLNGMTGLKKPTAEQLQPYLKIIVDDLIMLYDDGIVVKTPYHNATPCTKCKVSQEEFFTDKALRNEFPKRTGEEHRRLAKMHRDLPTREEKDEFFATHGAQWTEFARVNYFDLVRYTVVDPMHNLLLGAAKNQWFTRWFETGALRANTPKTTRELNVVHQFLESFEAPLWAGRLPLRVGETAGGSPTADEYKFATTGPWAIVIPLVWE